MWGGAGVPPPIVADLDRTLENFSGGKTMRYVATLILFALAAPCAAQHPYSEAWKRTAEAQERAAEAYDSMANSMQAELRAFSAWRAAGGAIDEDDYADTREMAAVAGKRAAVAGEWAALSRGSAANARELAYGVGGGSVAGAGERYGALCGPVEPGCCGGGTAGGGA